ncbi:MAG: DUF938 domain-containing protein [Luminiphilus sp.]|nr:DUF938 domain-containing protein [Luminiphilus sp.]
MALETSPAAERNRQFIVDVLENVLPDTGTVLEIASGTGQHAVYVAPKLSPRVWQPSDCYRDSLNMINDWSHAEPSANLRDPVLLDVLDQPWPVETQAMTPAISAIVAINMIHIAPWRCCEALLDGAQRILPPSGVLYLYGPFKERGEHTSPSNAAFDHSLKSRNSEWGIRDLEQVTLTAAARQLVLIEVIPMPANNLSVVFKRH